MIRRLTALTSAATAWLMVTAIPAIASGERLPNAHDNGEGWAGETTDKLVTFFSLGVVIFLAAFVIVMSMIQHKLESRHDRHGHEPRRSAGW